MNYSMLVDKYIKESGLTLSAIADKMLNEKGIKIDRSYISKLRKNAKYPATDEINRALAEITGGNPEQLIRAAYIEKAPTEVRQSLKRAALYENFIGYLLKFKPIKVELSGFEGTPEEIQEAKDYVNSPEFLASLTDAELKDILTDLLEDMSNKDKHLLNNFLFSVQKEQVNYIQEEQSNYSVNPIRKIPVLGQIPAGVPIERIEENEGYTLVDPNVLKGREGFALRVKGDSMTGDRIHDGDMVIVAVQEEVHPHEISVVAINGEEATLKRVKVQGEMVMLLPSNPMYEAQLVPAKDVRIIGKVVEVKFWPK